MPENLILTILTPKEKRFTDIPVKQIIVPAERGFLGIHPGHAPLIALLKKGTIEFVYADENDETIKIEIRRGLVEVLNNRVLILAVDEDLYKKLNFNDFDSPNDELSGDNLEEKLKKNLNENKNDYVEIETAVNALEDTDEDSVEMTDAIETLGRREKVIQNTRLNAKKKRKGH